VGGAAMKTAKQDLLIIFISALIPMVIYFLFEPQWRLFNQDPAMNFAVKFIVQSLLSFSLAGLGFSIVMLLRREKFSAYGLVTINMIPAITLSVLSFVPHLLFLIFTKGFHGYAPMSGAIIYDSVMSRPTLQRVICMAIIFLIWGFCEGFTYVYASQKINEILPIKNKFINFGAIICGVLCIMMHGGISLNPVSMSDALTMFIFVYGILIVKDNFDNAWGCIFSFLFLWNAFP